MNTDDYDRQSTVPGLEAPPATYRLLEPVTDRASASWLEHFEPRFQNALRYFDELAGETITVAHLKPNREYVSDPVAVADPYNMIVYFDTEQRVSNLTIFHELAHLEIQALDDRGEDVPVTSEEFCSIYAVALMDSYLIDRDRISYLGSPDLQGDRWPDVCRKALEYREDHRNYIQKAEEWLRV